MARAALLIIGSEMLDPVRHDANGPLARERLVEAGLGLSVISRVEDREDAIAAAVRGAMECCDVVITSGGLGPTGDDLTREGVARSLGRGTALDPVWLRILTARVEERGRALTEAGRRQALVVEGGEAVANPRGLACGTFLDVEGRMLFLLPGVPPEFSAMLEDSVMPKVRERFPAREDVRILRAIVAGLPEAQAEPVLAPWYRKPGVAVSILPQLGVLRITVTVRAGDGREADDRIAEARDEFARGFRGHLVSLDGVSLEQRVGELLLEKRWTLAAAESCTGGRAAHKVVSVAGASRYFLGGIVAYSNAAKTDLLGVPADVLARHGAVSEPVALAMARGARDRFGASCGIGITGIAGPDGGTPTKPVGLVHIAACTPDTETARAVVFPLDRASILDLSAHYALYQLWRLLSP